jgi:uncharacterized protein (DUF433 family)
MVFTRITIDPAVCTGKPCIRGLRFPVARLLGLMAAGETRDAIPKTYPYIESANIDEALRYAAFLAEDETVELLPLFLPSEISDRHAVVAGSSSVACRSRA